MVSTTANTVCQCRSTPSATRIAAANAKHVATKPVTNASRRRRATASTAEGQLLGNDRLQRDRHESQQQRRAEVVVVALVEEHRPGAGQQRSYGDSTHHHTGRGPAVPGTGPPMPAPEPDVVPGQTGMPTQYDEHDSPQRDDQRLQ